MIRLRRFPAKIAESRDDTPGSFFFPAYVVFPSLSSQGPIKAYLDTGSGTTIIGNDDLKTLGIELSSFRRAKEPIGRSGGMAETYELPEFCLILFDDGGKEASFAIKNGLTAQNPPEKKKMKSDGVQRKIVRQRLPLPSLIGRAFLRDYDLKVRIDIKNQDICIMMDD